MEIDQVVVDVQSSEIRGGQATITEEAVSCRRSVSGKSSMDFSISVEETCLEQGSELFTSYQFLTEDIQLLLRQKDFVDFRVELLYPDKELLEKKEKQDKQSHEKIYRIASGVLPYQGFRVFWNPRSVVGQKSSKSSSKSRSDQNRVKKHDTK